MVTSRTLALILHTLVVSATSGADEARLAVPNCASDAFSEPQIGRGTTILSVKAQPQHNYTSIRGALNESPVSGLNFCQIQVYLTHQTPNHNDTGHTEVKEKVLVEVWLPLTLEDWNGRLQATGGGGFATGMFSVHLGPAVRNGWAAVSTDGGHDSDLAKAHDGSWIVSDQGENVAGDSKYPQRKVDWNLLHNFASRSPIDQILIAKSITEQYYGKKPHHSYWNGCSTGGRQGMAVAQKYPELLDGVLSIAPVISFVNVVMGALWPPVVMNMAKTYLSNCELEFFRYHAIKGCEAAEETKTGILEDPATCRHWLPSQLIGEKFECDGQQVTVTPAMAEVVQKIHDGPGDKFSGLDWGVPMTTLANITIDQNGVRSPNPFRISASWLRYAVLQDQLVDISSLDEKELFSLWVSAQTEFAGLLNTEDPDLSRLRDSGTKILSWHGIDDEMIPYQNSINYRRKVEDLMGGAQEVDEYYRLFLAPGVKHCYGGVGPFPKDALDALTRWVEDNDPPETLAAEIITAEGDLVTRDLCAWPATARYVGIGDIKRASTWTCVGGTERPAVGVQDVQSEFDYGTMRQPQQIGLAGEREKGKKSQELSGSDRAGQILGDIKNRLEELGMGLRAE
jgi:pimeloyl-ACP methyl ester carboxylesterase